MIETTRLILKPLTYDQLLQYIKADNSLETGLGLNKTSRTISVELKEALEQTILPNVADKSNNYLYATLWTIILKEKNKIVADLCFTGPPGATGEIEIGYGTYEEFRGQGYMTEAVSGIIAWARAEQVIKTIIAATDKTNKASFSVLVKNEFIKKGETDTLFHWQLPLNN